MTDESDGIAARISAIERQIAYLYGHFGLDPVAADRVDLAEIVALIKAGKKVAAVKTYRDTFNASLADAARAVGRLE